MIRPVGSSPYPAQGQTDQAQNTSRSSRKPSNIAYDYDVDAREEVVQRSPNGNALTGRSVSFG